MFALESVFSGLCANASGVYKTRSEREDFLGSEEDRDYRGTSARLNSVGDTGTSWHLFVQFEISLGLITS